MEVNFEKLEEVSELLKVLAHPVRLCIVNGLLKKGECNVSHMQHCLDLPQSTVSQHLQKLKTAGLIKGERKGLEIIYRLVDERVAKIIELLISEE
ncbi:MAG: winged helix-turn-helix transcriptional regulator [Clostridia bacterium]|jgi:ArsR family transcriptional regulator|nr:winged helix-turn-helix transcriptional regulator [Clostridia bacterium]